MNFDDIICIGKNTILSPLTLRNQDPTLIAYFDFNNDQGIDGSKNGTNHLKYDANLFL
jgi:hypothetical protein